MIFEPLKSPIGRYLGGKQKIAKKIIPLIPKHGYFCEPFCGSAAVFFGFRNLPRATYHLNDLDKSIFTFWNEFSNNHDEFLERMMNFRIFKCEERNKNQFKHLFSQEETGVLQGAGLACFVFFSISFSFGGKRIQPLGLKKEFFEERFLKEYFSKIKMLTVNKHLYKEKLQDVIVTNKCGIDVIQECDSKDAFFYVDPPYPETYQGYKNKFSIKDFNRLTAVLRDIKGKFVLSCYQNENLNLYDFNRKTFLIKNNVANMTKMKKRKFVGETIFMNF